jgi:hypothetical protein
MAAGCSEAASQIFACRFEHLVRGGGFGSSSVHLTNTLCKGSGLDRRGLGHGRQLCRTARAVC